MSFMLPSPFDKLRVRVKNSLMLSLSKHEPFIPSLSRDEA
jgi:hypothetical protein